jgi:putative zinc finger/helix-turn-helix YgiT family protein
MNIETNKGVAMAENNKIICPNAHKNLALVKTEKEMNFKGADIKFLAEYYKCQECGVEVGTVEQTAAAQRSISDAYRRVKGLLTSEEIRENRKQLGLTQKELAKRMNVGVASIKRWEGGLIQSKAMNSALVSAFRGLTIGNNYTGNRVLSIPRIKLVMREFEVLLGEKFIEEGDMLLFDAKYAWYADMLAFREHGKSLTGATYAALPHGPQLNNYKELIELIRDADETKAEPLTQEERRVLVRIAQKFPNKRMIIDAAHREEAWKKKSAGSLMPYLDAFELTEI